MRRHALDGKEHPPTAYVFGTETGERVRCIRRAWETTVLYAHEQTPVWIGKGTLGPESRAALRAINLHFHRHLRRQFACTLLESAQRSTTCGTSSGTRRSRRRRATCRARRSDLSGRWRACRKPQVLHTIRTRRLRTFLFGRQKRMPKTRGTY